MSEGEIKKQIARFLDSYELLKDGGFAVTTIFTIIDEARQEFPCYNCNQRCVFCGRECYEFKEWFLKWFGENKK